MSLPAPNVIETIHAARSAYWIHTFQVEKSGLRIRVCTTTRYDQDGNDIFATFASLELPHLRRYLHHLERHPPQPDFHITLGYISPPLPPQMLEDSLRYQLSTQLSLTESPTIQITLDSVNDHQLCVQPNVWGNSVSWLVHHLRISILHYIGHHNPYAYTAYDLAWARIMASPTHQFHIPGIHLTLRGVYAIEDPDYSNIRYRAARHMHTHYTSLFEDQSFPIDTDIPRQLPQARLPTSAASLPPMSMHILPPCRTFSTARHRQHLMDDAATLPFDPYAPRP